MEEAHHDEINLMRLLRRLEKSVSNKEEWQSSSRPQPEIWLKTQSTLQAGIYYHAYRRVSLLIFYYRK